MCLGTLKMMILMTLAFQLVIRKYNGHKRATGVFFSAFYCPDNLLEKFHSYLETLFLL